MLHRGMSQASQFIKIVPTLKVRLIVTKDRTKMPTEFEMPYVKILHHH